MNILMMGGTQFVGRAFTEELLKAGHSVTHFNRGKTAPGLFAGVETIVGDRNEDLGEIAAREWDIVVDVNAYLPHQTERLNEALTDSVQQFVFVSTISVYDQGETQKLDEDGPLLELKEDTGEVTAETYGAYKVICEGEVLDRWGERATILRPGVIIGPHDHTDRFAYWPWRVSEGGKMLIPGDQDGMAITGLDVRDFAEFLALVIDRRMSGIFNVDKLSATFGELRATMRQFAVELGVDVEEVAVSMEWLLEQEVRQWVNIPNLLPGDASLGDVTKAVGVGLRERPLIDSMRDTWAWLQETQRPRPEKSGLSVEREKELLKEWYAQG
jgi:2'-hydroxyisoflavone reductase